MTSTPNGHGPNDERMVQYVLGELRRDEAAAFERLMAKDETLRLEVSRLRQALELLPYASVTEPPASLRESVLHAARSQAPPARAAIRTKTDRRVVWSRFAAAAAAALALAFGLDSYRLRTELALQRDVNAVLQEPNLVRSFTLAGTTGRSFGSVILDLDAQKGAAVLQRLAPLPEDQVYRLWARVGGASVPCGDFVAAADGAVRAAFRVPVESYTAPVAGLFVTVEPRAAGDRPTQPTGPTVMESV